MTYRTSKVASPIWPVRGEMSNTYATLSHNQNAFGILSGLFGRPNIDTKMASTHHKSDFQNGLQNGGRLVLELGKKLGSRLDEIHFFDGWPVCLGSHFGSYFGGLLATPVGHMRRPEREPKVAKTMYCQQIGFELASCWGGF